jgi:NhaA family Na+:H+ antiporter
MSDPVKENPSSQIIGGVVLFLAATIAMVWANSPWREVYRAWNDLSLGGHTVNQWINDALMAIFFFVVGLEIKGQCVHGELRTFRTAFLPVAAAVGGMVLPALIYIGFTWGTPSARGWGIPVATDIAFALGVMSLLGNRVPTSLRVFLLTLATADDIGGILIIAIFYSSNLSWVALVAAMALVAVMSALAAKRVDSFGPYAFLGLALWLAVFFSGIHPTIAGVLTGLLMPASLVDNLEGRFRPWTTWLVLPLFALSNSGVTVSAEMFHEAISHPAAKGVFFGLLIGKVAGIVLFSRFTVTMGWAAPPREVTWSQIAATGLLAGIGFTVSLFITGLSFNDQSLSSIAILSVLMASIAAAVGGYFYLRWASRRI